MTPKIILASSSPRRQEMLRNLGLKFLIHPSQADESVVEKIKPNQLVEQLAIRKANKVAALYSQGVVIGSDTIVVLDGDVLGKPTDKQHAFQMLSLLQGQSHSVYTGLALIDAANGEYKQGSSETKVHMRSITDEEIDDYISSGEPMDKAGAYAIQGLGSIFVKGIDGDYFSVVGMPIHLLEEYLRHFGIQVLKQNLSIDK